MPSRTGESILADKFQWFHNKSNKLRLGLNDEDIQPIGYELRKEDPAPKERIGDTSVNKILKRIFKSLKST